ncbi:hypothetical protein BCR44DRAFT_1425004 [Catenaria anguillulae PL171]|uniref:Uncharacterized protein n=1 Tax=Catenaria anguillulae PL171 TaxID=765915 RepID=A0A1Y2I0M9_9FUNG|nr:hypothetical protein BCR44DRAFT_1425004 [Catenaria anguillulae PL171]
MLAVILATYICLKRAQAIWVVAPRTSNLIAPIVSVAMVGAAVSARIAGTLSELNGLSRTPDPASLFSAQQFLRALVNFTAAAFALFSEGYVTSIIVRFRRRSATNRRASAASSGVGKHTWWPAWLAIPTSSADRMRLAYAVLICLTFLTQAGLQIAVMLRLTRFAPFHAMGWSLILIRIIEFRSELLASVLVHQPAGATGGGHAGSSSISRGPAGLSSATTTTTTTSVTSASGSTVAAVGKERHVAVRTSRGYMLSSPATASANAVSSFGGGSANAGGLYRSRSSVGHDVNLAIKPSPSSSSSNPEIPLARLIPGPPRPLQQLQYPVGHDPRRVSTAPGEVFSYYTMAVASVSASIGLPI